MQVTVDIPDELARRLRRLLDAGIPVFLLTGNHDMPNAVARAPSLESAVARAYEAVGCISFEGMQYRSDIAHRRLKR